jgi:hypothetical protein
MRVSVAGKIGLGFASLNERDSGDDLSSLAFDLQNLVGRFQLRADGEQPEASTAAHGEGVPLRQLKTSLKLRVLEPTRKQVSENRPHAVRAQAS